MATESVMYASTLSGPPLSQLSRSCAAMIHVALVTDRAGSFATLLSRPVPA